MTITIDATSCDKGFSEPVKGAILAIKKFPKIRIILLGPQHEIHLALKQENWDFSNKQIVVMNCNDVILNSDNALAFLRKNNSPLNIGLNQVKNHQTHGLISAVNSAALLAASVYILKKSNQQLRPGFMPTIPHEIYGNSFLLDAGANITLKPEEYVELAKIGANYYSAIYGKKPIVGLINIGSEETKGPETLIKAFNLLKNCPDIEFFGNVEPRYIFNVKANIFLCDGWTGNILLKTLEGTFKEAGIIFKKAIYSSFKTKVGGLFLKKALEEQKEVLDYKNHPGALVVGVNGLVMKTHGSSNAKTYLACVSSLLKIGLSKNIKLTPLTKLEKPQNQTLSQNNKTNDLLLERKELIEELLQAWNIKPQNIIIYIKALTHSSWSGDFHLEMDKFNYEKLEHLGDKAINYYATRYLNKKHPEFSEGEVSKALSRIVSNKSLALVAKQMNLGKYIACGKSMSSDNSTWSEKIWGSFFEGFIGAIVSDYQDNRDSDGVEIIQNIVDKIIGPTIQKHKLLKQDKDYKTQLQEYCSKTQPRKKTEYKTLKILKTKQGTLYTEGLYINGILELTLEGYKKQEIQQSLAEQYLNTKVK